MKKVLLPALLFFGVQVGFAQGVPNGGFENWTSGGFGPEEPTGWATLNILSALGNPTSVTKVTPSNSGNFAMRVQTVVLTNNPAPGDVPDTLGIAFTGSLDLLGGGGIVIGYPYTQKPTAFKFFYKFEPSGIETEAGIVVFFTKFNTVNQESEDIGFAEVVFTSAQTTFAEFIAEVSFFDPFISPDTAAVIVLSGSNPGSAVTLDDLEFTLPGASVKEVIQVQPSLKMFPNPTTDFITFDVNIKNEAELRVFSIWGKEVLNTTLTNSNPSLYVGGLAPGVYISEVKNDGVLYKQRFTVK
jgi:hypothetical protein